MRKVCELCGKPFGSIRRNQRYCSKGCRLTAYKVKSDNHKKNNRGQPCWYCQNATGGCSWSRELKSIEGWSAKKVKCRDTDDYTYRIFFCPLFKEDIVGG